MYSMYVLYLPTDILLCASFLMSKFQQWHTKTLGFSSSQKKNLFLPITWEMRVGYNLSCLGPVYHMNKKHLGDKGEKVSEDKLHTCGIPPKIDKKPNHFLLVMLLRVLVPTNYTLTRFLLRHIILPLKLCFLSCLLALFVATDWSNITLYFNQCLH